MISVLITTALLLSYNQLYVFILIQMSLLYLSLRFYIAYGLSYEYLRYLVYIYVEACMLYIFSRA
jgi:hypothetical protein